MINIALRGGEINGSPLVGDAQFQMKLTNWLMITCLICVPLMLFVKPIYLSKKYKKEEQ
jgi:hypothetical protein